MKTFLQKNQIRDTKKGFLLSIFIGIFIIVLSLQANAANITSLTTGNWSATAWPNTTRTGTITTSTTSTTVTGAGTSFTTEISVGNIIKTTGNVVIGTVSSITNNTSLVLVANAASTNTAIAFNSQGVGSVDAITLAGGAALTVDGNYTCASLTFGTSATSTLTISTTNTLSITGLLSMPRPATGFTSTFAVGAGTLTCGSYTSTATSAGRYARISISTGSVTISGATTTTAGTGGVQFTFTGAGTLNFGGSTTGGTTAAFTTFAGSTVKYSGAAQTAYITTYDNLTLSGSAAKTFATSPTVNGVLSLEGTASVVVTGGVVVYGSAATLQYNKPAGYTATAEEWITPFNGSGGIIIKNTGTITTFAALTLGASAPLNINANATLATGATNTWTLTVGGTTTVAGTLTLANTGAKTFTGNVSVDGIWNETGAAAINYAGNLTVNTGATFTANTGAHTFSVSGTTIGGTLGTVSIPSVSIGNGFTNNLTTAPGLNISTTLAGTGTLTQGSNAVLTFGGTSVTPTLAASANTNTVNYNAAAIQTVKPTTYVNLTLAGTSLKTTTSVSVNGILSMEGTATASAVPTYGASATLQYKGSASQTTGPEFPTTWAGTGGVKIDNANGTGVTLNSISSIDNSSLIIGGTIANSIFNDGGNQITASGTTTLNLNSGTFKLGSTAVATTFPAFTTPTIASGTTVEYASTIAIQTVSAQTYSNLTISGTTTYNKVAGGDITVNGVLTLSANPASGTIGSLDMSTYTLNMGATATTIGAGDVTGIVKRTQTFVDNTQYSFGNQYTTITFIGVSGGTKPGWLSCKIAIGTAPTWKTGGVKRIYSFARDASATDQVIVNLHYLDTELNSNAEATMVLWDNNGSAPTAEEHGKTNDDIINNWIGYSGATVEYLTGSSATLDTKQWNLSNASTTNLNVWLGITADWTTTSNWSKGHAPQGATYATEDVQIPVTSNNPTMPYAVEMHNLEIVLGATLSSSTYTLTINGYTGAWHNDGTFTGTGGTVVFSHANIAHVVSMSGTTGVNLFNNITVSDNTYLQPASGSYNKIAGSLTMGLGAIVDLKATNNTIEYNGASQTITNPQGPSTDVGYANLVINSSGTTTLPAALNVMRDFTLTAGTAAAAASSSIDILGNVTLTSGTFNASSAAMSVGGNWTNNGATFTAGTSTLTFNSTLAAQAINGTASSQTFNNIIETKSLQTLSVEGSTTSITANNFTETSGDFAAPSTLTVNGNVVLTAGTFTAGSTTNLSGNLTNNGASFVAGSGTVNFNNTALAQTIGGTNANTFNNVTIYKTSAGYGVSCSQNETINGTLYLNSPNHSATLGALDMGSYTLTMGASAINTGTGDVTGIVKRDSFALHTVYTFGNPYTSLDFSIGPLPSSISIKTVLTASEPTWMNTTVGINRYYDIKRDAGTYTYTRLTLNLHYLDGELNGATEASLDFFDNLTSGPTVLDRGHSNSNPTNNWLALSGLGLPYVANTTYDTKYWTLGSRNTGSTSTWISGGAVKTDWTLLDNWNGGVPTSTSDVVIPSIAVDGTHDYPILPTSTTINSIDILSGGVVNATTGSPELTIAGSVGAWNNVGTFNAGTSTVIFTNAAATMSDPTNFYNVTVADGASLTLEAENYIGIAGTLSLSSTGVLNATGNHNTVEYNGTDQTVVYPNGPTPGYHNLILSSSGTKTMPATELDILENFELSGTASATAGQNIHVGGNITIGSGTTFNASSFLHEIGGNWSNSGTFTAASSKISFIGTSAQSIGGTASSIFNDLTINSVGVSANANITVNGILYLESANASAVLGSLNMASSYKLSLGVDATTTGQGDVTGIVRRAHTFTAGIDYTFNHQYTTIRFASGGTVYPTVLENKLTIGAAPSWKTSAVKRIDDYIQVAGNGASDCYVTFTSHYLDSELNGNDENRIVRFKNANSATIEVGRSAYDITNNWVANSNIQVSTKISTAYGWERSYANSEVAALVWNGSSNTIFSNQNNWTPNSTPGSASNIIIPDASLTANDPTLTADITINTISIENGGILNSGEKTLTIAGTTGAWINMGTFNAGTTTGTVVFTGNGADLDGTTDFYNLTIDASARLIAQSGSVIGILGDVTINGTGGTKGTWMTLASGVTTVNYKGGVQTVVVPDISTNNYGNLILSGSGLKTFSATALEIKGDFSMSGTCTTTAAASLTIDGNVSLGSGNTFDAGSYTHIIKGDFTNNGTFTASTSTINLNGTSLQTLGGSAATSFNNLTLNNASGASLGIGQTIDGTFTMTSGKLFLDNYNFTLNTTNAIAGSPSSSKYIVYNGTGKLVKNIPAIMGSDYVFPIGSASNYSPASFKLASGTVSDASIAIGLTEGQHSNITAPNYINRYWTFTPTGFTSPVYDASFTYVDADVVGTESTIISSKYSSGWTQHLLTTEASNLLTILGATSFSDYTGYGTLALTPSSYINPVCSGTVTTISAYASGNNGALSYTWSPSGSGASFDPNPALTTSTMFYVTVTDALGATQRSSVYVTVDARQSVRLNFNYNNLANSLLTSGITAGLYYADTLRSDLVITPASGQNYYEFTNMCPKTYVVRATSTTPTVGTINGTDAAQVNYWGTHPYAIEKVRFYAGDVVGPNNTLTSTDAQRINNNFVNGASLDRSGWSFWNAGETISNQIPTPTESYPSVTLSAGSTLTANMYGLISGDFNMSYSPAKSLTGGNVNLSYEGNLKTVNNQEISLPIHLVNQNTIGAASLVLNFPADLVQIEDVVMNSTEGQLDWAVKNNELRIGWYTSNPITFNAGEQLLTIRLKTSASFNATSPVQFTLAANSGNEIADENFEAINNAQITMAGINGTTIGLQGNLDGNSKLSLSNRPNPFSGNTTITYELPFDGNLSLEIFDYMGRSVQMLINENQLKGNHSLMFDAKSLAAGIYVARLSLSNDNNKIVRSIKLINNR